MQANLDRRSFLKTAGALAAGMSLAGGVRPLLAAEAVKPCAPTAEKLGWTLCCQLYTFRSMPFYDAMEKIAALGIPGVEPAFFLPLDKGQPGVNVNADLSPELRKQLKQRLVDRGMRMINYYADLGEDEAAARKTFEFAKQMGVQTIVAEPPAAAFDMIEKLCDEFEINLAVHNHPRTPDYAYWRPEGVLEVCRGRSKRIGACCDTGHWVRSGLKPVECLKKMQGRIITVHLKDVAEWNKPEARDVPLGTGLAEYPAVLEELKRQRFRGALSIEYEHESPKLVDDVAQYAAFVEKSAKKLVD